MKSFFVANKLIPIIIWRTWLSASTIPSQQAQDFLWKCQSQSQSQSQFQSNSNQYSTYAHTLKARITYIWQLQSRTNPDWFSLALNMEQENKQYAYRLDNTNHRRVGQVLFYSAGLSCLKKGYSQISQFKRNWMEN